MCLLVVVVWAEPAGQNLGRTWAEPWPGPEPAGNNARAEGRGQRLFIYSTCVRATYDMESGLPEAGESEQKIRNGRHRAWPQPRQGEPLSALKQWPSRLRRCGAPAAAGPGSLAGPQRGGVMEPFEGLKNCCWTRPNACAPFAGRLAAGRTAGRLLAIAGSSTRQGSVRATDVDRARSIAPAY